jgi:hypothetical protein
MAGTGGTALVATGLGPRPAGPIHAGDFKPRCLSCSRPIASMTHTATAKIARNALQAFAGKARFAVRASVAGTLADVDLAVDGSRPSRSSASARRGVATATSASAAAGTLATFGVDVAVVATRRAGAEAVAPDASGLKTGTASVCLSTMGTVLTCLGATAADVATATGASSAAVPDEALAADRVAAAASCAADAAAGAVRAVAAPDADGLVALLRSGVVPADAFLLAGADETACFPLFPSALVA